MIELSPEEFVVRCQRSSNGAYDLFKQILTLLEAEKTRVSAYQFLIELRNYFKQATRKGVTFNF